MEELIELGAFVTAFTSVASQYRRYMRSEHPDLRDDATIYVRGEEYGRGLIADLVTAVASLIACMDQVNIVSEFVERYARRLSPYFKEGGRSSDTSRTELSEFTGQVAAIANSPHAKGAIKAVHYKDGKRDVQAAIVFDTQQARTALKEIENHRKELCPEAYDGYQRVLMTFKRSDKAERLIPLRPAVPNVVTA